MRIGGWFAGRGFDEIVPLQQECRGGFQIKLFLDRDPRHQGVNGERQDAAEKAPGDAHGEAPVLEVADSLVMRMLGKYCHFAVLPVEFREF